MSEFEHFIQALLVGVMIGVIIVGILKLGGWLK